MSDNRNDIFLQKYGGQQKPKSNTPTTTPTTVQKTNTTDRNQIFMEKFSEQKPVTSTPVASKPVTSTPPKIDKPKGFSMSDYYKQKGMTDTQIKAFRSSLPTQKQVAEKPNISNQPSIKSTKQPVIGQAKGNTLQYMQYLTYMTDDTKKKLDEGKSFFSDRNERNQEFERITKGSQVQKNADALNKKAGVKSDPMSTVSQANKGQVKIQQQLYDYFKDWWKKTPKDIREKTITMYKNDQKKSDEFFKYGIGKPKSMRVATDIIEGTASGISFGLSDKALNQPYKTEARGREAWYSPYNVSTMIGSTVPIVPAMTPIKKGLQKIAPNVFLPKATDSTKTQISKNVGAELTADAIAGTGYGIAQEIADSALDTRADGEQTFGERAKKVGMDAAFGLGLGVGIEGLALGFKGIKNVRDTKKRVAAANKFIEDATSELAEANRKITILNKADKEFGLNEVKRSQLGQLELKVQEIGWQIEEAQKIANPKNTVEPKLDATPDETIVSPMDEMPTKEEPISLISSELEDYYTKSDDPMVDAVRISLMQDEISGNEFVRISKELSDFYGRKPTTDEISYYIKNKGAIKPIVNKSTVNDMDTPDSPSQTKDYDDAVRQANTLINNVRNLRIDNYSKKEIADAQNFVNDSTIELNEVQRKIAILNVQGRKGELSEGKQNLLRELQSKEKELTKRIEEANELASGGNNADNIASLRQFVEQYKDLYTGDFSFDRPPTKIELPDIARNILMNKDGLIEKFMETSRQQQKTTLAERMATILKQQESSQRSKYEDFWRTADTDNVAQNTEVAKLEQIRAEEAAQREQARAEEAARAELPEYPDVPPTKEGRIEYIIANVMEYIENVGKKSESLKEQGDAKLVELNNERTALVNKNNEYIKNTDNVNRALNEYESWVRFVQQINALTKDGGGIKLGRGQKVPNVIKKGSIPIETLAQKLNMTVSELLEKMNVFQKMVSRSSIKEVTIKKKKRSIAIGKLIQEKEYQDIKLQISEIDELIKMVEEVKQKTYDLESRAYFEEGEEIDWGDFEVPDFMLNTNDGRSVVPSETEFFSSYMIEKWFPESLDVYENINNQKNALEKDIEQQEKVIEQVEQSVKDEFDLANEVQGDPDNLARILLQFVNKTRKKIHLYDSEEDYRVKRIRHRQMSFKDFPGWAKNVFVMKPSRKWRGVEQQSQPWSNFTAHIREQLADTGNYSGVNRRDENAGDLSDTESILYNDTEMLEVTLTGNPYGSTGDSLKFDSRVDFLLNQMGDENPRKIIDDLQTKIDDLNAELVKHTNDVVSNRLDVIGDLSDKDLVDVIRDIKGEQSDFDQLLDDYIRDMYPDRYVPKVEPIRLDEQTPATPVAPVAPKQQPAPQTPASPMNELPLNTPNQSVSPAFNNIPNSNTQTPLEAQNTVQNTDVQTPQETVEPNVMDEPMQTPNEEIEPTNLVEPNASPVVPTASVSEPINQPDFAENLRQDGVDEPGDYFPDLPDFERVERGFNETVRTSENTPEPFREEVQRETDANEAADLLDNPSWYAQKPNEVLVSKAIADINKRGEDDIYDEIIGSTFLSDFLNAKAQILIKRFINAGKSEKAIKLIGKISKAGTQLGRAVQTFSLYNKLDVDGVLLMAQRAMDNKNRRNKRVGVDEDELTQAQIEPLVETVKKVQLVDDVKRLALEVQEIVGKKGTNDLTPEESATIKQFEEAVEKLREQLPQKPSPKEVIEAIGEVEPRFRQRDAFMVYMDALEQEARKRLNKNRNKLSSTPLDQWKDYVIIGASMFAKGVIRFGDFSEKMIKAHGEKMRPYMNKLYIAALKMYRKERGLPSTEKLETSVKRALKEKKIDAESADNIMRMAMEVGYFSDEFRVELLGELQKGLRNIEGTSFLRKVATAQTIAQLLNPKTLIRNALGNEMFWRLEQINKLGSVGIDFIRSKLTGNERILYFFTNNQESYWKNFMIGAKAGWKGYAPEGLSTSFDLDSQVFTNPKNPFYWLEKALGVTLRSFDYAGYKRAYGSVVGEWATSVARREGLSGDALKARVKELAKNADDEITTIADEYGRYVTFQDDTILAQSFQKAKQALNLGKDFGLGDLILKYPTTPANLLMRAIDYSPVGIWRGFIEIGKARLGKDYDPRLLANSLSRGLTGVGITSLAVLLAELGVLTGSADKDADIRELEKSSGMLPYAVNVDALFRYADSFDKEKAERRKGDRFMTYDWMQPMAVSVAMGVTTDRLLNEKDAKTNLTNRLYDLTDAGLTTFMEQPLISGVSNLFKTYPDQSFLDKLIGGPIGGLPSSFTPTLSGQFRQLADNNRRLTFDNKNLVAQSANKVLDRIPIASKSLPISYDAFGKPIERYQGGSNTPFNVLLNPSFVSKYKPLPEAKAALDLYERTNDKTVAPRIPEKSLKDNEGITGKLSKEQYSELSKLIGEEQLKRLKRKDGYLNDPDVSDKRKIDRYNRILDVANKAGRRKFKKDTNYKASP